MFERLLGKKQSEPVSAATAKLDTKSHVDNFLVGLLSPHIIKNTTPEHQSLMTLIDTALEELMNSILHNTEFQALESVWLSVRDVIFNEEYDDENQQFYIINTDNSAVKDALSGNTELATKLARHIKDTDVETYDLLVGNYRFSANNDDVTTLNYLASLAETLKCQLVTAASDDFINCKDETSKPIARVSPNSPR